MTTSHSAQSLPSTAFEPVIAQPMLISHDSPLMQSIFAFDPKIEQFHSSTIDSTSYLQKKKTYDELIYQGVFIQYEHRYEQSVQLLTEAIELMPNEPEAYLRRALTYYSLGKSLIHRSLLDVQKGLYVLAAQVVDNHDKFSNLEWKTQLFTMKGLLCELQKDVASSKELYQEVVRLNPKHYFAHFSLGFSSDMESNYREAIEHYKTSVNCDPKYSPCIIYNNIGRCYELLVKEKKDKEDSSNTRSDTGDGTVTSGNTASQPNECEASATQGSTEEDISLETALKYYSKAIDSYGYCFTARQNRAKLYINMKKYEEAEKDLRCILDRSPWHYIAMTRLAELYFFNLNKQPESIDMFKRIQQIHCTKSFAFRIHASYEHIIQKNLDASFEILDYAIDRMLSSDQVHSLMKVKSQLLQKMDKSEEAERTSFEAANWPETRYGLNMKRKMLNQSFQGRFVDLTVVTVE